MNWERIKTFLIIFFVLLNLFLIGVMMVSFHTSTSVGDETIRDTVDILAANQIALDPALIPRSVENLQNFDVRSAASDSTFPGAAWTDENGRFSYQVTCEEPVTMKTAKSAARKVLKDAGIEKYAQIGQPQQQEDGGIQVTVRQKIRRYWIFNSVITIVFHNDTAFVSGLWYCPETMPRSGGGGRDLVYVTSVLVDFINNPDRPSAATIAEIAFGYRVSDYDSGLTHKTIPAVPCYRIITDDGSAYDYNAGTGEYFAKERLSYSLEGF